MGLKMAIVLLINFSLILNLISSAFGRSPLPNFIAISPNVLRPNSIYPIHITLRSGDSDTKLTTFGLSLNCSGKIYDNTSSPISSGQSTVVPIQIQEIPESEEFCDLDLLYDIAGNQTQNYSKKISIDRKESFILIQTDKPIYKPGETVLFRVILLNRNLRPIIGAGGINVTISDPGNNVIKRWKNGSVNQVGVHSSELLLSPEPNLGNWKIQVNAGQDKLERSFKVDQYTLPKYSVQVIVPPFLTFSASVVVVVEVKAFYTYGEPISGNCTVTLVEKHNAKNPIAKTKALLKGRAYVEFDVTKELDIDSLNYEAKFLFHAAVEEDLTGRRMNATKEITMYKHAFKIEKLNGPTVFIPGFPVEYKFRISTPDNIPIVDERTNAVQIRHGFSCNEDEGSFNSSIPADGIVVLKLKLPTNELYRPSDIEVTYKEFTETFYVGTRKSSSRTHMQVAILTAKPKYGQPIDAILRANKPFSMINYVVTKAGQIVLSGYTKPANNGTESMFSFVVPSESAGSGQEAILVVYGFFGSKLMVNSVKIQFENVPLDNYLEIDVVGKRFEPGENLTLEIKSKANSTVFLKAIDQSVLLLKGQTDITEVTVRQEFEAFIQESQVNNYGLSMYSRILNEAGLVSLTDIEIKEPREPYGYGWGSYHAAGVKYQKSKAKLKPTVRKHFPETWIWDEVQLKGETAELSKIVPDTLTSWVISGYSLSSDYGIGVISSPKLVESFRSFFLSLNLPYSVVKGEIFELQILVHNYIGQNISTEVTLNNAESHFDFVDENERGRPSVTKTVAVSDGEVSSVTFVISPNQFGIMKLDLVGVTPMAGDALSQPLRVRPPGHKETINKALLLSPALGEQILSIDFPLNRVSGADEVKITIIGDLLGASVTNLDNLIQLPAGCGEQNMLNFVPDIVILEYLSILETLTAAVKSKTIRFLESGYQRQLTYMRTDGSFSAFGKFDAFGSTWLTAYVTKSFAQASKFITIDEDIIAKGISFLLLHQSKNGKFIENGRVIMPDIQGGASDSSDKGLALTSYVIVSLIQISKIYPNVSAEDVKAGIQKGLLFMADKSTIAESSLYSQILASYTFQLADHAKKDEIFNLVEQQAKIDGNLKYWETKTSKNSFRESTKGEIKPVSIEMTSYVLMTYLLRGNVSESIPIVRWLLQQRNSDGGFLATQDTVIGLTALANFALLTTSPKAGLRVKAVYDNTTIEVEVTSENSFVLQEYFLPGNVSKVVFNAEGTGTALVQLSGTYYVQEAKSTPKFYPTVEVFRKSSPGEIELRVCNRFDSRVPSNMGIMEINLPSGYHFEADGLEKLLEVENIRRYDLESGETKLNVYLDSFSKRSSCINVNANRAFKVVNPVPASILVYDYYDNSRKGIMFYNVHQVGIQKQ